MTGSPSYKKTIEASLVINNEKYVSTNALIIIVIWHLIISVAFVLHNSNFKSSLLNNKVDALIS